MKLAERHIIKKGHKFWAEIDELSGQSKNLYNAANYIIRQNFIYGHGYLTYNQMDSLMKQTPQYKALPAKVSQQVLRGLEKNWKSFFRSLSEYKENQSKFLGKPKIPGYKNTKKGRNLLVYTIQAISKVSLKKGFINPSKSNIKFPTKVGKSIAEVRIVPKCDCYVIEVIYEETEQLLKTNSQIAAIDLGVDNLMAVTSNQPGFVPLLINGRPLKSLNQFYNRRCSKLQSLLQGNQQNSQRIRRLTRCRNHLVDDYLHQASRYLVNLLMAEEITTLVIGYNPGWKQEIELGSLNNQKFVTIPHRRLIEMITYKCKKEGIKVILQEESYTSVANFLNLDPLPVYGEETEKPIFTGKRIKRGLYKSDRGQLVQADVIGSYNILRKAFPNAFNRYGIERCVVHPRRINLSK
ncbi:RNA-guided endonuclease InsQ/TnpB family protein [Oscillatoria salina]|uniref:RNA-guided endonuclease InsQ/TnpB family protein n=1 Tax=Oscillatoria salina TaxID=331517 RepID=UPI001CCF35C7|nr:RNA-guided endonuclease TnpB family protein [Oscillatoria salina]MBZ8178664.1 IS200/IS605 family element transposase accessory protein TnpB [Oscillatoria salina IIICB1]